MPECDESVGDETGLPGVRIVVGVVVGDAAEIFEGLEIILRHAVALGVHAPELPLRDRVAFLSRVLKRVNGLGGFAGLQPVGA